MGLGVAILVGGASDGDLAGAQVVEIHERVGEPTTYRLRYALVAHDGDIPLLSDARLDAGSELAVVHADGYLVKGPVTGHRVHFEHGMIDAWIDVLGADVSIAMDRETKTKVWSDVTASDVVQTIASSYGMTADVQTTPSRSIEDKHTLVQRDTDLRFVRRLARRYGFHFWSSADDAGMPVAHFKRASVGGDAGTSLRINLDASNTAMVDLHANFERPTSAVGAQLDLGDKTTIDGAVPQSPLALLGGRSLLDITGDTRTVRVIAPVGDADDLKGRGEGALIEAGWFVRVTCSTSIRALGALVRPDRLVDLQGLGARHSGKYWVHGVRHLIDASAHVMELELYRNAWGS